MRWKAITFGHLGHILVGMAEQNCECGHGGLRDGRTELSMWIEHDWNKFEESWIIIMILINNTYSIIHSFLWDLKSQWSSTPFELAKRTVGARSILVWWNETMGPINSQSTNLNTANLHVDNGGSVRRIFHSFRSCRCLHGLDGLHGLHSIFTHFQYSNDGALAAGCLWPR